MTTLHDGYKRPISNLRISLNSGCNLRCIYCHREGESQPEKPMDIEDIRAIIGVGIKFGIKSIKFTGGEPLLRRDIVEIIGSVPKEIETSITTNGTLLGPLAQDLKNAGLSRVNISIDSLNQDTYKRITGIDGLSDVLKGVQASLDVGLIPVKINMVLLKNFNEDEIEDFIRFVARDNRLILQIIELMDLGDCPYHADLGDLEEKIARESKRIITRRMHHRKKYCYHGAEVEFVKPWHNSEFCKYCNRLRVTSDGKLKPCLLRDDNLVDIKGKRGDDLIEAFKTAIKSREPYNID